MTRDEALELFRGREDGIAAWNSLLNYGETIPNLAFADLHGAILVGAELSGADLRGTSAELVSHDSLSQYRSTIRRSHPARSSTISDNVSRGSDK